MRGNSRPLLARALSFRTRRRSIHSASSLHENLISNPIKTSPPAPNRSTSLSNNNSFATKFHFSTPSVQLFLRTLSSSAASSSSSGASNIVLVKSDEELNSGLKNVQEKSSPAVFYFTAVWCGPCKFISPVIEELSKKYPHATIYKVDIDTAELQNALAKLHVAAVDMTYCFLFYSWNVFGNDGMGFGLAAKSLLPTLDFYKNGKKATTIVGADVAKLKNTMESLYG
ncbi:unnamed protein product [Dovyalis caffra]|uniref:Thioredoxin domain-containing protein n=1 Tax=Dovyalis caffra TaxID=77055 RepID=A0AAV1SUF9_9ROSI|nr:unnamed protein product [Dovyalis caffra]